MKQATTYKQGETCNNKKFRYCDVSNSTFKCINCEKPFNSELKDGDHITGNCDDCGKLDTEIVVDTIYKDGRRFPLSVLNHPSVSSKSQEGTKHPTQKPIEILKTR